MRFHQPGSPEPVRYPVQPEQGYEGIGKCPGLCGVPKNPFGAGYKGGEIVPSFFVGATFGCLFGNIIGFSPSLCAAVGMTSLFCGVTNCPITSLLISFELFGYDGMPYFLLAIPFSYMLSGYFGLYRSQRIVYSKYKTNYINKPTH